MMKALRLKFNLQILQNLLVSKKYNSSLILDYEYVQGKFKPLERIRNVEFSRDWGLGLQTCRKMNTSSEHQQNCKTLKNNSLSYQLMNYNRGDEYNGFQNDIQQFLI